MRLAPKRGACCLAPRGEFGRKPRPSFVAQMPRREGCDPEPNPSSARAEPPHNGRTRLGRPRLNATSVLTHVPQWFELRVCITHHPPKHPLGRVDSYGADRPDQLSQRASCPCELLQLKNAGPISMQRHRTDRGLNESRSDTITLLLDPAEVETYRQTTCQISPERP